jgi:hypothetical protein
MNDSKDRPGVSWAAGGVVRTAANPDTPVGRRCTVQSPMAAGRHPGTPPPGTGPAVGNSFATCLIGGPSWPAVTAARRSRA